MTQNAYEFCCTGDLHGKPPAHYCCYASAEPAIGPRKSDFISEKRNSGLRRPDGSGGENEYEKACGDKKRSGYSDRNPRQVFFNDAGSAEGFAHAATEYAGYPTLSGMQKDEHNECHAENAMYDQNQIRHLFKNLMCMCN
jgi:hypothetical protein